MLAGLARGDGHPVLVMPGFGGGDSSTFSLRTNLGFWGYDVHGAGEEVNSGPTPELLAKLDGLLVDLYQCSGRRVSLVGWSIAGRCARYLTRLHPEMVRQVITMACPLQFRRGTDRGSISFIVDPIQHTFAEGLAVRADHVEGPLPVPSSSIYSRTDGVIRWPAASTSSTSATRTSRCTPATEGRRQPLRPLRHRRPAGPPRGRLAPLPPAALAPGRLPPPRRLASED